MEKTLPVTAKQMKDMLMTNSSEYIVDMDRANFSEILNKNLESKEKFYELMDDTGRLIIPIELDQEEESLKHLVLKFTQTLGFTLYNEINNSFSFEEIVENKLNENKKIENYDLELGKGMKFSKALIKLMEKMKYPHDRRERVINDYSLTINEKKLKGTLVLSVNPIDFLTMSLSETWSSCLSPGGEYESGTMGYAVDSTTVIAFLISSKDADKLRANEYVNKKWRKILVVSDQEGQESILASRGYPYDGEMLTDEAIKHLSTLLFERNMVRYDYESIYNRVRVTMGSNAPGYSDVGLRNKINVYSVIEDLQDESHKDDPKIKFVFSKAYLCIHCQGEYAGPEAYACDDCGGYDCCEDCGDSLARGEEYYTAHGYIICESCMDNSYAFANNDDELYHIDELTWVEAGDYYVTNDYAAKHCGLCKNCSDTFETEDLNLVGGDTLCDDCLEEKEDEEL